MGFSVPRCRALVLLARFYAAERRLVAGLRGE
jgi:hypothetical protein